MELEEARELFDSTIRGIIDGMERGNGQFSLSTADSTLSYLDSLDLEGFDNLVESLKILQDNGEHLYQGTTFCTKMSIQRSIRLMMRKYLEEVLIQESMRTLTQMRRQHR